MKKHRAADGMLKLILGSGIISIGTFNIITHIVNGYGLFYRPYLTFPIILVGIYIIITNISKGLSLFLYISSIYFFANPGGSGDVSAAIFIMLSFSMCKNKAVGILYIISTYIFVPIGFYFAGYNIFQTLNLLLLYTLLYAIYYFVIYKKAEKYRNIKNLTKEQNKILNDLVSGKPQKQIAQEHGLKQYEVSDMLKEIRGEDTLISFIYKLGRFNRTRKL